MDWSLADRGVDLDGIYYCPQHPQGLATFRQDCDCRKPKPGMLLQGIRELNIDPEQSFMVGDKIEDLQAAEEAKVRYKILVKSGKTVTLEGEQFADVVLNSLADLPQFIEQLKI